jgi:hypothetical protein
MVQLRSKPVATLARAASAVAPLSLLAAIASSPAAGSMIIDRNATSVRLTVDGDGKAVVSYRVGSRARHVLAWGAINAQVRFRLDYTGGRKSFGRPVWRTITTCLPYDGPELAWLVTACKARDGSYWAVQRWQRLLPSQGHRPFTKLQASDELHLSHWRGPLPQLDIFLDWVYGGRYHHLFGRYHYNGHGVHGHRTTSTGVPLDPYGRNIYLDSFGSAHGNRWARINAFIAHKPNGTFCYGFFPRRSQHDGSMRPAGHGTRYRATAIGPGVAPDPYWEHAGLGAFDPVHEADMNRLQDELMANDRLCRQH